MPTKIYNRTLQLQIRRKLRKNEPVTERLVWSKLRNRQLKGYKFRRQYGIGNYIVDFYCPESMLAIEIDGDSHYTERAETSDLVRKKYLESFGVRIIRFTNKDVMENIDGIIETISKNLPPLIPPYKGGKSEGEYSSPFQGEAR